jgi:hypothetical protein
VNSIQGFFKAQAIYLKNFSGIQKAEKTKTRDGLLSMAYCRLLIIE